jgi:two-component system sensor histidine kinase HydH
MKAPPVPTDPSVARRGASGAERFGALIGPFAREVRTPMASLLAGAEILMEELGPHHRCSGYARLVYDASARLNETLHDLAAVTLSMKLTTSRVDLAALVRSRIEAARPRAERHGLRLATRVPEGAAWVEADPAALRLALARLLNHLIDVMPGGGTLKIVLERVAGGHVVVGISDTGPSVSAEDADRLFEPYFTSGGRRPGLALAVVRRILAALGGEAIARPHRCGGVVFELRLPLCVGQATASFLERSLR